MIAGNGIVTCTRINEIASFTAEDEVATGEGRDRVSATRGRHRCDSGSDNTSNHGNRAMVTQHDVVAFPASDDVSCCAAENHIVTREPVDGITGTEDDVGREEGVIIVEQAVSKITRATAADQRDHRGAVKILHASMVAEEDIIAGTACNVVGTGAAKNDYRQRRSGCVNGVIPVLRVEHEETVGRNVEHHRNMIVAAAGVERRDGEDIGAVVGARDADDVGARTGPEGDALGKAAGGGISQVGDVRRGKTAEQAVREERRGAKGAVAD